jgi:magnesium transporter
MARHDRRQRARQLGRTQQKRMKRPGLSPGTLVHTGEQRLPQPRITVIDYDAGHVTEKQLGSADECAAFQGMRGVSWINVDGLHDTDLLARIGERFHLHPLVMEDVASVGQRPKLEAYDDYLFVVLRQLSYDEESGHVQHEQFSMVLGSGWVLSFQENVGDVLDPVRERIRGGKGRIRKLGADYLAYAVMDAIVDHYFIILEKVGERIQELEDAVVADPRQEIVQSIHALRQEALYLRKSVWPLREVLASLQREESRLISPECRVFLRDVYDHTIQVVETVETYRDLIAGMLEIYLSSVNNRLNEVMKVLTMVSTIFIPLSFLASIYGMNFLHMPELQWRYGYFAILALMAVLGVGMLFFFRHKKWL